jgi:hypothetical protein
MMAIEHLKNFEGVEVLAHPREAFHGGSQFGHQCEYPRILGLQGHYRIPETVPA